MASSFSFRHANMIDKELLTQTVMEAMDGTDMFPVDIKIGKDNNIVVEVGSATGVDIDACVRITRRIEEVFDRDVEDYELEVGSAGITSPMKVREQFEMNIGNDVEVLTRDGRKLHGVLSSVLPGESRTDVTFTITRQVKVKEEGKKKPVITDEELTLRSDECKYVIYDLKF